MTSFMNEYESDISDIEGSQEVTAWLDEIDPEEPPPPPPQIIDTQPKIDIVHKSKYIVENLDLFYALCEVDDWGFVNFNDEIQEEIMKTLKVEVFNAGENIITEGDIGNDLYFVMATEDTAHIAEVEVVNGNLLAGTEVFLTRLHRGQYFGQKFFLTRRANKRGATVRVPYDSPCPVEIATLTPEFFDKWENFRNLLLVRTVPLIQILPRKERLKVLENLQVREFKDGEYIIRQGEIGEDFFIIQEGSVKVVEKRPSPDKGWEKPQFVTLVTLREGHFFGEMSLVTDEPRVASVISVKNTICLVLTKSVFRSVLSDESFNEVLSEVLSKRKEIRKQREKDLSEESSGSGTPDHRMAAIPSFRRLSTKRRSSFTQASGEVNISTTLSMKKLESGYRLINKYIVERELGKGSFGDVYLCKDQETGNQYAMKMINRPTSTWNDEASNSIKQEIAVMKRLKHQNIVCLHEVIDDQNARKIFLIQEFMEGGPLMPDSDVCDPVPEKLARKYFRDILRGVCYLHSEGIVHRDIKPQNMLLSMDGTVKIADFGAAVFTGGLAQEKVAYGGTPAFMAPELFFINPTIDFGKTTGIDIFALGATLYFMVIGRPPWMAKNQIDLATKIKNIELTFPIEKIDPHLKHLLRHMLAKDYRTRITLDSIVVDDWVTFEGSEPLFEHDDFIDVNFGDFTEMNIFDDDNNSPPKILLIHESLVIRTMLAQQINNLQPCLCAFAESGEDALSMMKLATTNSPRNNFDFIFIELEIKDMDVLSVLKSFQDMGYTGRILGMTANPQLEVEKFVDMNFVSAVIRRPIANRELSVILAQKDMGEMASEAANMGAAIDKVSQEEVEQAITFNLKRAESRDLHSPTTLRSDSKDTNDEEDDDDVNLQDFQSMLRSSKSPRPSDFQRESSNFDLHRINFENKSLSRKRGFMVVPYGASADGTPEDGIRIIDKPLKIFSINKREETRRKKREAAMRKSRLAHQYRQAKINGEQNVMTSSRSLLNLIKMQSRRSMYSSRDATPRRESSQSSDVVSLQQIDQFINNMVEDPSSVSQGTEELKDQDSDSLLENSDDNEFEDASIQSEDGLFRLEESYEDEDDSDEDDEDDDDFGLGGDEIQQLDDEAMDAMFAEMAEKKDVNENQDIQEWNHIMVSKGIEHKLLCTESNWGEALGIRYGQAENVVSRPYMEDRIYASSNEQSFHRSEYPLGVFCVFDGHNGDYVAQYLKDNYAAKLCGMFKKLNIDPTKSLYDYNSGHYESIVGQAFDDTAAELDLEILQKDYKRQCKCLKSGIQDLQSFAGSVSVVMCVMPSIVNLSPRGNGYSSTERHVQVFISHQGDCRAVLCNDGVAVQLTEDHKANLKSEKVRIESAGGWVHNGRVNGSLGVSRSYGDIQFKNFEAIASLQEKLGGEECDKSLLYSELWGSSQQVISKPEFKHFYIEMAFEFVILACDGLWDVFTCQEAVNFVRKKLAAHKDLNRAANELIQKAISRGTQDNTSVVIVAFHQMAGSENKY